jgi:uncharacterized membrane protein
VELTAPFRWLRLGWNDLSGAPRQSTFLIGFATSFVGFIALLPLIGHATWHAPTSLVSTPSTTL